MGNFLVISVLKSFVQHGSFKCVRPRWKTCPFIHNVDKMLGPKRSIKITDHFICTSANVIHFKKYTLCKKLHTGETGRKLRDRFGEHLWDIKRKLKTNIHPNHSLHSLIYLTILTNIWQSVAFLYIMVTQSRKQTFRAKIHLPHS